jgi:hypothetical protein
MSRLFDEYAAAADAVRRGGLTAMQYDPDERAGTTRPDVLVERLDAALARIQTALRGMPAWLWAAAHLHYVWGVTPDDIINFDLVEDAPRGLDVKALTQALSYVGKVTK